MVIYLRKRNKYVIKYLFILLLIIFIYGINYVLSYLKYNDSEILEVNVLKSENNRLRKELRNINDIVSYDGIDYKYVIGKVIIRDIHNFYNEIVINLGSDKVMVGNAVVSRDGLVGIITKVEKDRSYVKLLSSDYNVSVVVNGNYGNYNNLKVSMISKYSEIKEGDVVYTSGLVLEIPYGIYVGTVSKVDNDQDNLGKELKIITVNNDNLNYIAVITGEK